MKPIDWARVRDLPGSVAQLHEGLRLNGDRAALRAYSDSEWRAALYYLDRHQMALLARHFMGAHMPGAVRERLDRDYAIHRDRLDRIRGVYTEVREALAKQGIEPIMLKGFSGAAEYGPDPTARVQYDLDLYCPDDAAAAHETLLAAGYRASAGRDASADHLPPLVRGPEWSWGGDFFDPAIPIAIEIHHRLWDPRTERLEAPGLDAFARRSKGDALEQLDALGYKALHVLRHLLRGELRAAHLFELAWFLHQRTGDDSTWRRWESAHEPGLRRLEAVSFALAASWFAGDVPASVEREIESLPQPVLQWLEDYGASPARAHFRPNKDELRLHLRLLDSMPDKLRVMRRRLLPASLPNSPHSSRIARIGYLCGRAWYHLRAAVPTIAMARTQKYKGRTRQ